MVSFFTIPRPFTGEFTALQRQAISSWRGAIPHAQIILFGDEEGVRHNARDLGVTQCLELEVTDGSPRTGRLFDLAERYATHGWMLYTSCDIVFDIDLEAAVFALKDVARPFVIGRRWDIDAGATHESAKLHAPCGVDYFLYRKGQIGRTPNFHVRGGQGDNWFVWAALHKWDMTVIDATDAITAIHVNHSHPAWANGKRGREGSREQRENMRLAQGGAAGIDDAPFVLTGGRVLARGEVTQEMGAA